MSLDLPAGCQRTAACLDYDAYAFDLSSDSTAFDPAVARTILEALGRIEREDLGVVYIRSDWGHIVLPPPGFPELKVVFHHGTYQGARQRILDLTAKAILDARRGHKD